MARYFFHIRRDGDLVRDGEGDEFPSIGDARANAVKAVRELVAARIKSGQPVLDDAIEVCNEADEPQFSVSFHDVVRGHLKSPGS